jgi:hypothetical protein
MGCQQQRVSVEEIESSKEQHIQRDSGEKARISYNSQAPGSCLALPN